MNPKDSERLSRYLDGELTPNETRQVEAWLETSPEAREEYATMKQIHETTLDILPQTRFRRPNVAVRRRRPFLRLAAAAAAVVLFGGVVFGAVQVYEAFVAETATTVNPPPDAPPPAPEEAVAPSVIVEDSSGEPTAESVLMASEDAPSEPASAETSLSIDELSAPPLTGVVTSVMGEPISGASVRALAWLGASPYGLDEDPLLGATRTDASGRFSMDWPAGAQQLLISARGYESADVSYSGAVVARQIELHVKLLPETVYTGQVVDIAGNPIPDVRVAAELADDPSQAAVTDADGMFTLASRTSSPTLYFSHPDYAINSVRRISPTEPFQVNLTPGASLRLRVVQGGEPVPGAKIRVISEIPEALGYPMVRETDETGCVLFDQVPLETSELENLAVFATAPNGVKGRLMEVPELRVGATAECVITLAEEYPGAVSGTVTDTDGNPVSGTQVIVGTPSVVAHSVRTDENGFYSAGLPLGTSIVIVAPDLLGSGQIKTEPRVGQFEVNTPGTEFTQDFTLSWPSKDITFVRSDGTPVEEVWLSAWPVLPWQYPGNEKWKATTAGGHIRTLCDKLYNGIAYDADNKALKIFGMAEDLTEITVVLDQPAGAIAGRIVDPNGQPLAAASVNSSRNAEGYPPVYTWSDAEGHFRIEPLPLNAAYDLSLSLQGYQLLPGSAVTGIQPAPEPVELAYVMAPTDAGVLGQVVAADGSPLPQAVVSLLDGQRGIGSRRSGNDGTFYFQVAEGVYTMWVVAPDLSATESRTVSAPSQDTVITLPVPAPVPIADVPPPRGAESDRAQNNFKQMGLVFKMFANEAAGEMFPPLENRQGAFTPEWNKIYPEYLTDTKVLFPDNGVSHCYFAHALTNETQGMAFLKAVQQLGIEAVRDQDIQVGAGNGSAGGDVILRLHEGLERRLFPDQPASVQALAQANIPILWEVPGEREESGGWVLYMDGHVQWQPYPGPFPMTEAFVSRLRGMMGLD